MYSCERNVPPSGSLGSPECPTYCELAIEPYTCHCAPEECSLDIFKRSGCTTAALRRTRVAIQQNLKFAARSRPVLVFNPHSAEGLAPTLLQHRHSHPYPSVHENDRRHCLRYPQRPSKRTPRRCHRLNPARKSQTMLIGRKTLGPPVSRTAVRAIHAFGPDDGTVDEASRGESAIAVFVRQEVDPGRGVPARLDGRQFCATHELLRWRRQLRSRRREAVSGTDFAARELLRGRGWGGHIPSPGSSALQRTDGNHELGQYTPSQGRQALLLHVLRPQERSHTRSAILQRCPQRRAEIPEGVYLTAPGRGTPVIVPLPRCRGRRHFAFGTPTTIPVGNGVASGWTV